MLLGILKRSLNYLKMDFNSFPFIDLTGINTVTQQQSGGGSVSLSNGKAFFNNPTHDDGGWLLIDGGVQSILNGQKDFDFVFKFTLAADLSKNVLFVATIGRFPIVWGISVINIGIITSDLKLRTSVQDNLGYVENVSLITLQLGQEYSYKLQKRGNNFEIFINNVSQGTITRAMNQDVNRVLLLGKTNGNSIIGCFHGLIDDCSLLLK